MASLHLVNSSPLQSHSKVLRNFSVENSLSHKKLTSFSFRNCDYDSLPQKCSFFGSNVLSAKLSRRIYHMNSRNKMIRMGLSIEPSSDIPLFLFSALPFASFLAVRAFVYFRMQYIIAAMLGRHVPRGGSRVVDLNLKNGKNLYYVPADVIQVTAINPTGSSQVIENQAITAGVPVDIRTCDPNKFNLSSNSFDSVISVYGLSECKEENVVSLLKEAARILKPGKPFIFVESNVSENAIVFAFQSIWDQLRKIGGKNNLTSKNIAEAIQKTKDFENVQFEKILEFQDPHVVGIAVKRVTTQSPSSPFASASLKEDETTEGSKKRKKGSSRKQGF